MMLHLWQRVRRAQTFKVIALLLLSLCSVISVQARALSGQPSEALLLSFSESALQSDIISVITDNNVNDTGWNNAMYNAEHGVVIPVEPGVFSLGVGVYIPDFYAGPGTLYLHRVYVTDQNHTLLLDESFDSWLQSDSEHNGLITHSEYTTSSGNRWLAYTNTSDVYRGGGQVFEQIYHQDNAGVVLPMDGGGPFTAVLSTQILVPDTATELRVKLEYRYRVMMAKADNPRLVAIATRSGNVAPESLFSFSAPTEVTLTFDSDGGSVIPPFRARVGEPVIAPPTPVKNGYLFSGWMPEVPSIMPDADMVFKAIYQRKHYQVNFDLNGGIHAGGGALNQQISYEQPAEAPLVTAPDKQVFIGWSMAFDMVTADLNVVALYRDTQYPVSIVVNGAGIVFPTHQLVNYGAEARALLNLTNPQDIIAISGNCAAGRSGYLIVTGAITAACDISVHIYPPTAVQKESERPLSAGEPVRFNFTGGAGDKVLSQVQILRAGIESLLDPAVADTLIRKAEDGSYLFSASRTGRYVLEFIDDVSGELITASFDVLPYVAFTSSSQPAQQSAQASIRLWLSDEPLTYPVTVQAVADGVLIPDSNWQITAQDNLSRVYPVMPASASETASIRLEATTVTNAIAGSPATHQLVIQQQALPIALKVIAKQAGIETYVIDQYGGPVTLQVITEEHTNTQYQYQWQIANLTPEISTDITTFSPQELTEGRHMVSVVAQTEDGRTGRYDLALRVIAGCPVADCSGAGISGIPQSENAFPTTLNRLALCPVNGNNRGQVCDAERNRQLYIEVSRQYVLSLGAMTEQVSWESGQFAITLPLQALPDQYHNQLAMAVNFDIKGLEHPGEVVSVVIPLPQATAIPENAVWRKYINGQWQNFVSNSLNMLESAPRNSGGYCPGVSEPEWAEGLVAGFACVRLTIEDGGPNDDDGIRNRVIRDPGVIAVRQNVQPPVTPPPVAESAASSGGSIFYLIPLLLALCLHRRARAERNM